MILAADKAPDAGISNLYVALIAGGFLIAGALIAFLASIYTNRKQLERADRARWDNEILECALSITDGCQKIAMNKFEAGDDVQKWLQKANDYVKELDVYLPQARKLDFIASPDVSHAANQYMAQAFNFAHKTDAKAVLDAQAQLESARKDFRKVIRKELRAKK